MFRDTSKELARLEAELLAEEESYSEELPEEAYDEEPYEEEYYDEEPEGSDPHSFRAYNTDVTDEDLEQYAETVRASGRRGLTTGLTVLLCLLTLGIVALVALFLRQEGLL